MRLVLACLVLFLAPGTCLVVTDRFANNIEAEFKGDAEAQIQRLERITQMYPPKLRTLHNAPAILQLRAMGGNGERIAQQVCGAADSPYRRLFDFLPTRCAQW